MEDFDILYMMKTPFFMGNTKQVAVEAPACEVDPQDEAKMTRKNLLLLRSLTVLGDMDGLKTLI